MKAVGQRVVLAIRAGSDARFLDEAGALAQALDAELAALYVEEVELLRLAGLPFTREIGVASGAVLQLDANAIARRHRRQADAVRARVAATARALGLAWSFDVTRGSLLDAALAVLTEPDLLVLEPTPTPVQHALGRAATPGAVGVRTDVAVLHDATAASERALEVALLLAGGRPERVTLVVDDAGRAAARAAASRAFGDPPLSLAVVTLAELSRGGCPRVLVVPLERFAGTPAALRALRATAPCPLVVVR